MVTYGDNPREYPYSPQKRKKQKYTMVTRVVNFTNNLPITSGGYVDTQNASSNTTAWAAGDVLQLIHIRAGQTVMAAQVEVLTHSKDAGDVISFGYGSDTARWGRFNLKGDVTTTNEGITNVSKDTRTLADIPVEPLYFSAADTLDIIIHKAASQGKVRLIVHLLEDDR